MWQLVLENYHVRVYGNMLVLGGVPQWEVKAKKELAMWKQHLPIAKAIAQSEIVVLCAT